MRNKTLYLVISCLVLLLCYFAVEEYRELHRWDDYCNVMSYGAKRDGVTDASQAIQKTIDECPNGKIYLPYTKKAFLIKKTININREGIILSGEGMGASKIIVDTDTALRMNSNGENFSDLNFEVTPKTNTIFKIQAKDEELNGNTHSRD